MHCTLMETHPQLALLVVGTLGVARAGRVRLKLVVALRCFVSRDGQSIVKYAIENLAMDMVGTSNPHTKKSPRRIADEVT